MTIDVGLGDNGRDAVLFTNHPDNALVVMLTADQDVRLTAGPVAPRSRAKASASTLLYIGVDLGSSMTDDQLQALRVTCTGWQAEYLEGLWSLAPTQTGASRKTAVRIEGWPNFTANAGNGQVYVEYDRFGDESKWRNRPVMIQAAPGTTSRPLKLSLGFGVDPIPGALADHVTVSDDQLHDAAIENTLVLRVTNREPQPIVAAAATAGVPGTRFKLMFPAGEEPSATTLTTLDDAQAATPPKVPGWSVQFDDQAGLPCWTLTPAPDSRILGAATTPGGDPNPAGDQTVEIVLSGLIVPRPTGTATIYLQHLSVPDHDDGFHKKDVTKVEAQAGIIDFKCLSGYSPPAYSDLHLSWMTHDVDRVELAYTYEDEHRTLSTADHPDPDDPKYFPFSTLDWTLPDKIADSTPFTLTTTRGGVTSRPWQFWVIPISPEPTISEFSVTPPVVDMSKHSVKVKLAWSVADAHRLEINTIGKVDGTGRETTVAATTEFVLDAFGHDGRNTSRRAKVYDFPDFLTAHIFRLKTSKLDEIYFPVNPRRPYRNPDRPSRPPETVVLTETLVFDRDHTGTWQGAWQGGGMQPFTRPFTWSLAGDIVTIEHAGAGALCLEAGGLTYTSPLPIPILMPRSGARFTPESR